MKDLESIVQSATEIALAHKPTFYTILAGLLSSFVNAFEFIPGSVIAKISGVLTVIVAICLANYHRKNTEKVKLEIKILEMQIQREQAEAEQKRRRDDK